MRSLPEVCLECGLCDTCKSPHMPGSGSEEPLIMFVGEAPGANEDAQGKPFVGKAGEWLRNALDTLELDESEFRLTNVVRCRPPDNRTPRAKEVEYCSQFLVEEIRKYGPEVVVLLGNTPLKAVLGETGITTWNGVVVERDGITYVPAYHPSYFNYGNADKLPDWLDALGKAVEIVDGLAVKEADADYEYIYPKTADDIKAMLEELLAWDGYVAYDVECIWLEAERPGNKVLSVAFGIKGKAWSFPLYHDEGWWGVEDVGEARLSLALEAIRSVLETCDIIGHNIRFDCKITRKLLGIEFEPWGCTQLLSQLADTRKGVHGLKRLAGLHLGMFDYDVELRRYCEQHPEADYGRGGHYGNVPLDILLPYGGMDAAATWLLYEILEGQLEDSQRTLYEELIVRADYELGIMEGHGFNIDEHIARRYSLIYSIVQDKHYESMLVDPEVERLVQDRRTGRVSKRVRARYKHVYRNARKPYKYEEAMLEDAEPGADSKFEFNPGSSSHAAALWYVYKGYDPIGCTDSGRPSCSADNLRNSDVAEDSAYESFRSWKLLASMRSKYLNPACSGEWGYGGRAYSSFHIGGTKTGRLSSSNPNFQNIPTPEKEPGTLLAQLPIKNIFTHTWEGGCLCAVDYGSMELRVMASLSNCPGMIQVFKDGKDPHCYVTRMVFPELVPEDADDYTIKHEYKPVRYKAKWTNWTLLFGGDEHTLFRLYGLPRDEAAHIVHTYYTRFPEISDFQQRTRQFAGMYGYVESPFGRRLVLPYINEKDARGSKDARTAVNMPIQSSASDILMCALVVLGHELRERGMRTMLVNTVHDSIVADVYPGELDTFVKLAIYVLENVAELAGDWFPRLDFSWLRVPLVADAEVGSHYGVMEEL